jgi:hypothetical protein
MGVNYNEFVTPLVQGAEQGIWKPGYRCPDVTLKTDAGETTRLYAVVAYGHFIVLSIGKRISADLVPSVVYNILPHETANQADFTANWVKAGDSLVVVVRPDMYVGYVGSGVEDQGWKMYLDTYSI